MGKNDSSKTMFQKTMFQKNPASQRTAGPNPDVEPKPKNDRPNTVTVHNTVHNTVA